MKENQLGRSDLYVSEIGFGTMSLPKNEKEALYIVEEAMDRGVNFFDTADLYDQGRIETILGRAVQGKRDQVIIATKGGNHWEKGIEGWYWDPSKAYIKEAFKQSLIRLNTDYVDLYQLHGGTIDDPIDETIEAFEELREEGLIRYYGISSIRPNVIREYIRRSNIVSVMMQYSLLDRRPEETVLDLLVENKISVIARGPVARGILSDEGLNKIPDNGYLDYTKEELEALIPRLKESTECTATLSEIAIRYCLSHPAVATVVPGASRIEQLEANIKSTNQPELSLETIQTLQGLTKMSTYQQHR